MAKTLIDLYPGWDNDDGIFTYLGRASPEPPWGSTIPSDLLNENYYGMFGSKIASPFLTRQLTDGQLNESAKTKIASLLANKYSVKWKRLWELYNTEYNPIHNYDMNESVIRDEQTDGSGSEKVERTSSGENTTTHGKTITDEQFTFGFNSSASDVNPAGKVSSAEGGATGNTGTQTDNSTGSNTTTLKVAEKVTTVRSGNIGVTTSQQMFQQEIDLWVWNYFDEVFRDLNSEITVPIYDMCRIDY